MSAFETDNIDWTAFRRQVERALQPVAVHVNWYERGVEIPKRAIKGLSQVEPGYVLRWRRTRRAHERSRRNTAGQRRRRKHGARR